MGAWAHEGSPYLPGSPEADRIERSEDASRRAHAGDPPLPPPPPPRTSEEIADEHAFWKR